MGLAYDMFDTENKDDKSFRILERIYHKGHNLAWEGKQTLNDLVSNHGMPSLSTEEINSLGNIFNIILWGELAAWKISAALAYEIDNMEAKMAATSQAHDEARHFYVMKDYLDLISYTPKVPNKSTDSLLNSVLNADSLAKKLLGMQLMVEPVAITIFRFVRERNVEPVLSELLSLYERDESRHIALGVQYLPKIIKKLSWTEKISLLIFQIKILSLEIDGLKFLEEDFNRLSINPEDVFKFAEEKQLEALQLLAQELGVNNAILSPLVKVMNAQKNIAFSRKKHFSLIYNFSKLLRQIVLG